MRRFSLLTTLLLSASALAVTACANLEEPSPAEPASVVDTTTKALPGGIELIETVKADDSEIGIPFSKYKLPNGLTLVLHEDKSDPLVHVDITYHVGSGREEPGRSGFAHFFEHMMFQGSDNVGDEAHFKIISESGGTLNGSTNTDRTNYYETVPSNQLEKVLWLEADRMGFFLDAVTEDKFENQRETVKNERGQNYDNRPYGLVYEKLSEALYPEGHPYSWLTIGYIEDLNRADLEDLKRFFLRWYGPNNATLTIGGDLDKEQTLEWVAKYFGSIPEGPAVDKPEYVPVKLEEDRYISYEDNIALPLVLMAYPTVHRMHPDEAPLDVLMSIMGEGRTSLLYKNMVRDGMAVQASAGHGCQELSCVFTLTALPNPTSGATLADLEATLRASLAEFETRGVNDDDLQRVKAGIVSGMVFGLESVSGKVSDLAAYETFHDDPNYIAKDIARYENVTAEDVVRVYETYIKDAKGVILSVVPKDSDVATAAPDSWTMYERNIPERGDEGELELRYASDDFDRSVMPPAADFNPAPVMPTTWEGTLANGVEILGAISDEVPTTAMWLSMEVGERQDPLDKLGLASMTAAMLNEATLSSTNEELSNRIDKLGSSVSISAGSRFSYVSVRSLTENLDETLAIARERLMEPAFTEEDFKRVKEQTLQGIEQRKKQASAMASEIFSLKLYGLDNPSAWSGIGTAETVNNITLEDVKTFYETWYKPSIASVVIVSDLTEPEVKGSLELFADWTGEAPEKTGMDAFPTPVPGKIYLHDKPGAAQSEIRIGKLALPFDATGEYYRARLMNFILGGAFNSRINLNLREDKGYSYGARSGFSGSDVIGTFTASAGVRTDSTADSIRQFMNEISAYHETGIAPDELDFTKSAIGQSEALDYETPYNKLGFISDIQTYDLPDGFVEEQAKILQDLTKEEVDALAAKWLDPEDMIIVVVGDVQAISSDLEELGYPIILVDETGQPIEE